MKRLFSVLLIALLLVFPVLSSHAEGAHIIVDEGVFSAEALERLEKRAAEIYEKRGVAVYFLFNRSAEDIVAYTEQFLNDSVPEEDAVVLGLNAKYYHFAAKGGIAGTIFTKSVFRDIGAAFESVKGNDELKVQTYLDSVDSVMESYYAGTTGTASSDLDVPDTVARTDGGKPTLVDRDHLLTETEAQTLSERLKEIGSAYQCDVIIVTVPSLGGKTSEAYADDFFDYNGYGYGAVPDAAGMTVNGDGILLLISREDRDFAISTSGYAIKAFTDYGIQTYLEGQFLPYLSDNDFNRGFHAFADACETLLKTARQGIPYDCRRFYADTLTDAQLLSFNDRADSIANGCNIGIYFLESDALTDANAFLTDYIRDRLLDTHAIVLVSGPNGYAVRTVGSLAQAKFTDEKLAAVKAAVEPFLGGDTLSAATAYLDKCYEIVSDYAHVLTGGTLSETTRRSADNRLKQLFSEHGIALYFLYDEAASDPEALVKEFMNSGVIYEQDAVILGANASDSAVAVRGSYAREKFTDRRIAKLKKEVAPYLPVKNIDGAFEAFAQRSDKILNWRPVNWLTFAIAAIAGGLFGFGPVNSMKRQLTSVSKQTSAEAYMVPASFVMTQNSNVLLGKNVSRSVHVVRSESSGGGRSGGGGGGFHGGSSTHTSSSGGTHGGHSGKF